MVVEITIIILMLLTIIIIIIIIIIITIIVVRLVIFYHANWGHVGLHFQEMTVILHTKVKFEEL